MIIPAIDYPVFRSCLYVPGHQPDRIERAYASEADAVIIDLEDAVPGPKKALAREIAAEITAQRMPKPTYVRVNCMNSGLCKDDVRAVAKPGLTGVRIAKAELPDDVERVADILAEEGCHAFIHVLIESAQSLEMAFWLAKASPAVGMLGLGESDLMVDLHADLESPTMDASRARVIIASRAACLPSPCQSVYPEVRDLDGLRRSTEHGKRLGFAGRMAIHPAQLPIIHDVYTPGLQEIASAQEICAEAARAEARNESIVITAKGRFIGPPIIASAMYTLKLATALNLAGLPS